MEIGSAGSNPRTSPFSTRARCDGFVPIDGSARSAKAEMPFANDSSGVASGFQQAGQCRPAGFDNKCRIAGKDSGAFFAKGILARHQAVTRWGACGCARIPGSEPQSFPRQTIACRGRNCLGAVAREVAITNIVGINDHHATRGCGGILPGGRNDGQQA